jgi:hypothetical protein
MYGVPTWAQRTELKVPTLPERAMHNVGRYFVICGEQKGGFWGVFTPTMHLLPYYSSIYHIYHTSYNHTCQRCAINLQTHYHICQQAISNDLLRVPYAHTPSLNTCTSVHYTHAHFYITNYIILNTRTTQHTCIRRATSKCRRTKSNDLLRVPYARTSSLNTRKSRYVVLHHIKYIHFTTHMHPACHK